MTLHARPMNATQKPRVGKICSIQKSMTGFRAMVFSFAAALALGACAGAPPAVHVPTKTAIEGSASFSESYRLGAGDKLRVNVYGEEDLSGEYLVGSEGDVSLPLIGEIAAGNMTLTDLQEAIGEKLRAGYIKEPRVSVEITNYRPFYIFGEVKEGGEFPYQAGMSVLNAIAMAGGYSYRANMRNVYITHKGASAELRYPANQETIVMPGDVIRISERFF